ncbi:MAG: hypothetical protein HPY79_00715 [Bacteroidales bacterium]|nr:hypothetical protein [Bacteroidales bacterium]
MKNIVNINSLFIFEFNFLQMKGFVIFLIIILSCYLLNAQSLYFELNGGWSGNLPSKLKIKQQGFSDINFIAHYDAEPFISPVYWLWRFYYIPDSLNGWMFEAVHHKLYLKNTPPEIQYFGISHGLNMLIINRIYYPHPQWHVNIGIGTVLAHPENKIRNYALKGDGNGIWGMGYYLCGISSNISTGIRFFKNKKFQINIEARFNASYSIVPIVNGKAYVLNFSPQIIAGLGYRLWQKQK